MIVEDTRILLNQNARIKNINLRNKLGHQSFVWGDDCLLYTSDAADERPSVDLGGRRIIKKKINMKKRNILADEKYIATTSRSTRQNNEL